jgi:hypothetical protein
MTQLTAAIRTEKAARAKVRQIKARISAMRATAGVPDLAVWHAPFEIRDELAAAEAAALVAYQATAKLDREAA